MGAAMVLHAAFAVALLFAFCLIPITSQAVTSVTSRSSSSALSQSDSRRYNILFHEAMLQRQKGNADAAFDLLLQCAAIDSTASETYYFLSQYYGQMKQTEQAMQCIEKAAALEPQNITYMGMLASAFLDSERYGDAIEVIERIYAADKSRQELLESLYRLYSKEDRYDEAIGVLERIEAIDGKTEHTSLAKSSLYIEMGDTDRAMKELKTLADEHPNDLSFKTIYANSLMISDRRDEALQILTEVLTEEPDNIRAQSTLRNFYLAEDNSAAVDSITRLILLNPKAPTADKVMQLRQIIAESEQSGGDSTQVLALFHEMMQQPEPDADIAELMSAYMDLKDMPRDSVAKALETVLELAPDRTSARLRLVQYAWEADDNDRIISLCQTAREYTPEEMAFYYYQGMAYFRKDDTDHALGAFQNGINVIDEDSSPMIVSDFYAVLGDLLFQKHRDREAFEAYDSCLQWKPDNVGCLNNYAYYLSLQGDRLDEAEQMSYKTIKAEPKNPTYLDTYAWILFMQQRYAEARIYIDQALQNDTTGNAVIYEHGGDIHAMAGDMDEALRLWDIALEFDPNNKILLRKIKRKKYIKQ